MTVERSAETMFLPLPIASIRISSTNPRQSFDLSAFEDLKRSIEASGLNTPLLVRPRYTPKEADLEALELSHYELVTGSRRLRAVTELEHATVACLVREMSDGEARDAQIIENLQRADVHPAEEAEAYAALIHAAAWPVDGETLAEDLTPADVARRVGKTAAYVAQRLKLLELTLEAKQLFVKAHLGLDHALLLARLTPVDQERALRFMLDSDPKFDKRDITAVLRGTLGTHASRNGEDDEDEEDAPPVGSRYVPPMARIAKNMWSGRRVIEATAAQLRKWIEGNILLKLVSASWPLDDPSIVPEAGACVTCPKRSGSNAALFADLTSAEDVCLDPKCFAAKQVATMKRHTAAAKASCGVLLKISVARSTAKLDELAVQRLPLQVGNPGRPLVVVAERIHVTRKTLKAGQWLRVDPGSCADGAAGLFVDGESKGQLVTVCANQTCKVHKHDVDSVRTDSNNDDYQKRQRELAEKQSAYLAAENPVRRAVYAAIKAKTKLGWAEMLRRLLLGSVRESASLALLELRGSAPAPDSDAWKRRCSAHKTVLPAIGKAAGDELLEFAFDYLSLDALKVEAHMFGRRKADREVLWALAKSHGVDADAIAKAAEPKPAKKVVAKKVAAKKTVATKGVKSAPLKKLDPEARKRIADAMKKRWADARKVTAKKGGK